MRFKTIFNEEIETPCAGCIVRDNSKFKDGRIFQSRLWDLSQDFEIAYPGMMVISPMRHISNYADLTEDELKELHILTLHCKKAIAKIFNCEKIAYLFYEKPNGHIHFVIIPLHGLVKIENKYSVLGELMDKANQLQKDKENMTKSSTVLANSKIILNRYKIFFYRVYRLRQLTFLFLESCEVTFF